MTPRSESAAAFQYVLEHAVLTNPGAKADNTSIFADTLTAWPVFLNRAGEVTAAGSR